MGKEEILTACNNVFDSFDALADPDTHAIIDLCDEVSGFEKKMESIAPELSKNFTKYYCEFINGLEVAFSLGFVIGQQFEITSPESKEDIEFIKEVIREKALLPYLPREKAGKPIKTASERG